MNNYIKPACALKRKPDHVILHVGTNNFLRSTVTEITARVAQDARIKISDLITRDDKQMQKEEYVKSIKH